MERLQRQHDVQQQKLSAEQARPNRTKPLEELNETREEIKRKIEEDRRIMDDENSSRQLKQAAAVRVSENTDELAGLVEQIQEREEALPLRERVKNIFKKYGWTLQAVALAVGIVLSALALAGMNGLKAGTKAVGQGLLAIGKKLPPARAHRLDRELHLQSRGSGFLLPGGARLAAHPCRGGLLHGKAA